MSERPDTESVATPGKPVWVATAAAVLALPLGKLVAEVFSVGQDGPGMAVAGAIGTLAMIAIWVLAVVAVVALCRGKFAGFETRFRASIVAAVLLVPVVIVVSSIPSQQYSVRLVNDSAVDITNVVVTYGDRRFSRSTLIKDKYSVSNFVTSPPKGVATVSWTDGTGANRETQIDLSAEVPRRYNNGVLTFRFNEDGEPGVGFFIRRNR